LPVVDWAPELGAGAPQLINQLRSKPRRAKMLNRFQTFMGMSTAKLLRILSNLLAPIYRI